MIMSCLDLTANEAYRTTVLLAMFMLKDNIVQWPQLHCFMERYNLSSVVIARMVKGLEKIPPNMYDFFITFMGIAMNVPVSIVCASCIYTNVPDAGQYQLLFPTSILLMCQEGSLYILEKSNQKKYRLGMSPLYIFTKETQEEMSRRRKEETEEKILESNKGDSSGTDFISSDFQKKNSSGTELHRIMKSTSNFNMQMEVCVEENPVVCAQPTEEQPEVYAQTSEEQPEVHAQTSEEQPQVHAQTSEVKPEVWARTPEVNPEGCAQTPEVNPEVCAQTSEVNPEVRAQTSEEQPEVRAQTSEVKPEVRARTPEVNPEGCAQTPEVNPEVCAQTSEVNPEVCAQTSEVKEEKVQISSTSDDTQMYNTDSDTDAENCAKTGISQEIDVAMVVNAFIQTPMQSHDETSLDSFEADTKLRMSQMSEIEASILIDSEKYKEECGTDSKMRRFNRKIKGCENSL